MYNANQNTTQSNFYPNRLQQFFLQIPGVQTALNINIFQTIIDLKIHSNPIDIPELHDAFSKIPISTQALPLNTIIYQKNDYQVKYIKKQLDGNNISWSQIQHINKTPSQTQEFGLEFDSFNLRNGIKNDNFLDIIKAYFHWISPSNNNLKKIYDHFFKISQSNDQDQDQEASRKDR